MDADDAFVSNISRRTDVDTNGYLDVIAHGTPNGIQITHNGQHMTVDHRTASRLIQNSDGYNGQTIRGNLSYCAVFLWHQSSLLSSTSLISESSRALIDSNSSRTLSSGTYLYLPMRSRTGRLTSISMSAPFARASFALS